jgi:hypothetical protein
MLHPGVDDYAIDYRDDPLYDGETGVDNGIAEQGFAGIGACGFLGAICSVLSEALGRTTDGRVGGATIRHITRPSSC